MPEDVPLKVETSPIDRVIAYASDPRKRSATAGRATTSVATTLWRSASRRRRGPVQHKLRLSRFARPVHVFCWQVAVDQVRVWQIADELRCRHGLVTSGQTWEPGYRVEDWRWEAKRVRSSLHGS